VQSVILLIVEDILATPGSEQSFATTARLGRRSDGSKAQIEQWKNFVLTLVGE
jgi:hypothetical protein